jgi:hypothetical protein
MQTLEVSLSNLVADGAITYEDALSRSLFPKELTRQLGATADVIRI